MEELRAIRDALAKTEMRMVGGSLLIVYESSWEKVKEALDRSQQEALEANVEDDVNGDDEDSDDERKVVKSAAAKRIDEMIAVGKTIENALKINDWVAISNGEFCCLLIMIYLCGIDNMLSYAQNLTSFLVWLRDR